jgi:hypothetical protein
MARLILNLQDKNRALVKELDKCQGVPCEQIRHQQEVDELQARITTLCVENQRLSMLNNMLQNQMTLQRYVL